MELSCPLGIRALSRKYNLSCFGVLSHIINPLLTKLVRSRWLDIGQVLFLREVTHSEHIISQTENGRSVLGLTNFTRRIPWSYSVASIDSLFSFDNEKNTSN